MTSSEPWIFGVPGMILHQPGSALRVQHQSDRQISGRFGCREGVESHPGASVKVFSRALKTMGTRRNQFQYPFRYSKRFRIQGFEQPGHSSALLFGRDDFRHFLTVTPEGVGIIEASQHL